MRLRVFRALSRASIFGDEMRRVKRECDVAARCRAQIKNQTPRPGRNVLQNVSCVSSNIHARHGGRSRRRRASRGGVGAETAGLSRSREAARPYWSVVVDQRAASEYPGNALRRIALMYFGLNREYVAADVFIDLAESAGQFGDCVRATWPLLKSPAMEPSNVGS
jgi:hypothetical protein